jgi:hypothetical protein
MVRSLWATVSLRSILIYVLSVKVEGIRAAIIDKDRSPKWQFADMNVPLAAVSKMLQPLGASALKL